jgi:hypothetical protein
LESDAAVTNNQDTRVTLGSSASIVPLSTMPISLCYKYSAAHKHYSSTYLRYFFPPTMPSALEQLTKFTSIVADTGDFENIKKFKPIDATTNPTLILQAFELPQYQSLLSDAVNYARQHAR